MMEKTYRGDAGFVGEYFGTKAGGRLYVARRSSKAADSNAYYDVVCSICHADKELFPEYLTTKKASVLKGFFPCACSSNCNYSKEQWRVRCARVNAACEFVGFFGEFIGQLTPVVLRCGRHPDSTTTTAKEWLKCKHGCMRCVSEDMAKRQTLPEENMRSRFFETGKYGASISFIRMKNPKKWRMSCSVCAEDKFALHGCISYWVRDYGNFLDGKLPCRCSFAHRWTRQEDEVRLKSLGHEFVRWEDERKKSRYHDLAILRCKTHGEFTQKVAQTINAGSGCQKCAVNGFNPGRPAYLYCLVSDCMKYVKVGITGNTDQRIGMLKKKTPFGFSIAGFCAVEGSAARNIERAIHEKYGKAGLRGFDGATEWLFYNKKILNELPWCGEDIFAT